MKYLSSEDAESLNAQYLSKADVGDCFLTARVETYSCKATRGDAELKKCIRDLNQLVALNWNVLNLEYSFGASLNEVSFSRWDEDDPFEGEKTQYTVQDGLFTIADVLSKGLNIHCSETVSSIKTSVDGVEVTTANRTLKADVCILTTSLGVLKEKSIQFDPVLPKNVEEIVESMGFGHTFQLTMIFDQDFWSETVASSQMFGYVQDTKGNNPFHLFISFPNKNEKWFSLRALSSRDVSKLENKSPKILADLAMEPLRNIFGNNIPHPVSTYASSWVGNSCFRGTGAFISNKSQIEFSTLTSPIHETIYLSGEATCREYLGTLDGALLSGYRTACKVMEKFDPLDLSPLVNSLESRTEVEDTEYTSIWNTSRADLAEELVIETQSSSEEENEVHKRSAITSKDKRRRLVLESMQRDEEKRLKEREEAQKKKDEESLRAKKEREEALAQKQRDLQKKLGNMVSGDFSILPKEKVQSSNHVAVKELPPTPPASPDSESEDVKMGTIPSFRDALKNGKLSKKRSSEKSSSPSKKAKFEEGNRELIMDELKKTVKGSLLEIGGKKLDPEIYKFVLGKTVSKIMTVWKEKKRPSNAEFFQESRIAKIRELVRKYIESAKNGTKELSD